VLFFEAQSSIAFAMALNILSWYRYCTTRIPFVGNWLFNLIVRFSSPYTGTLGMKVLKLEPGSCKASISEWWLLRNPFNSIHAAALLNLGKFK
jgi:Domain of unknown function (DUF4442)